MTSAECHRAAKEGMDLDTDWIPVDEAMRAGLERELHAELAPSHPLAGASTRVLARAADNDDILVELAGGRCVVVHLTWSGRVEEPPWPWVSASTTASGQDAD